LPLFIGRYDGSGLHFLFLIFMRHGERQEYDKDSAEEQENLIESADIYHSNLIKKLCPYDGIDVDFISKPVLCIHVVRLSGFPVFGKL
jgi:hypothetical protein